MLKSKDDSSEMFKAIKDLKWNKRHLYLLLKEINIQQIKKLNCRIFPKAI